jgi:hypothetical protein
VCCTRTTASPKSPTSLHTRNTSEDTLTVWPCLPIFVQQRQYCLPGGGSDNIVAALEHNDPVCETDLFDISSSHLEKALAAMQEPALTKLEICRKDDDGTPPVVPDLFYGSINTSSATSRLDTRSIIPKFRADESSLGNPGNDFRDHQDCYRLPLTSSISTFGKLPILATFHPRRSSLASPH